MSIESKIDFEALEGYWDEGEQEVVKAAIRVFGREDYINYLRVSSFVDRLYAEDMGDISRILDNEELHNYLVDKRDLETIILAASFPYTEGGIVSDADLIDRIRKEHEEANPEFIDMEALSEEMDKQVKAQSTGILGGVTALTFEQLKKTINAAPVVPDLPTA